MISCIGHIGHICHMIVIETGDGSLTILFLASCNRVTIAWPRKILDEPSHSAAGSWQSLAKRLSAQLLLTDQ